MIKQVVNNSKSDSSDIRGEVAEHNYSCDRVYRLYRAPRAIADVRQKLYSHSTILLGISPYPIF